MEKDVLRFVKIFRIKSAVNSKEENEAPFWMVIFSYPMMRIHLGTR